MDFLESYGSEYSLSQLDLSDNHLTLMSFIRLGEFLRRPESKLQSISLRGA